MTRMTHRAASAAAATLVFALALQGCGGGSASAPTAVSAATTATTAAPGVSSTDPVEFSAASYSVVQSAGSVTVPVTRTNGSTGAISVDYATADGTAVAGTDYSATSGTLQWAENDATDKSISIPISNVTAFSGARTFDIVLSGPSAGAKIGNPGTAVVTISGAASAGVGNLQLAAASFTVAQSTQAVTISVNRDGGAVGPTSVAYATANGSAIAGTDYTATNGVLEWGDGDSAAKSFTVPISNAKPFSGGRTFSVALSNPGSGATLGTPDTATVTVLGSASGAVGSVELGAASYSVAQNGGKLTITVDRTGGSSGPATVDYATRNGTAIAGTDFTASNGTLSWADTDGAPKSFSVAISDATPFSGSRTFTVLLSNPSAGVTISNPGTATATISGSGSAAVGTLELDASSYSVNQAAGSAVMKVDRTGGSSGTVSVSYSTISGTAVAGTDFTASSGKLSWANGDSAAKSVAVPISNAKPFSGTKSFTLALSGPSSGTALGSPSQAITTITGDAQAAAGSVQLSAASYGVAQAGGSVHLTVNRTGGSTGAVSVSYATSDQTALAGTDYTAASGTLQWSGGDTSSKTISIAVSNATPFSGTRAFGLALSKPTGGAALSSPESATITITGSGSSPPANSGNAFWVYRNGVFNWGGDYSYVAVPNYQDTSGDPLTGPYDIAVTITGPYGGFQPYAGGTVPLWNFDDSPYTYLTFAFKPTVANQTAQIYFMKVGDIPVGIDVDPFNGRYGPAPQVGTWSTYKIPLSDLGVAHTSVYKFALQDQTGLSHNLFYIDNLGFE